jgi:hypothetical protein
MPATRNGHRYGRLSNTSQNNLRSLPQQKTAGSIKKSKSPSQKSPQNQSPQITQDCSIYKPLNDQRDQIRLFTLLPDASYDAPLRGTLEVHAIQRCPQLKALSYFWGDPTTVRPIVINDASSQITHNLDIALRNLCDTRYNKVLWIDALCINQSDPLEKNHQIAQMGKIYQNAASVLVWLGPEGDNSDLAFDFMNGAFDMDDPSSLADLPDPTREALAALHLRPYWERAWIL